MHRTFQMKDTKFKYAMIIFLYSLSSKQIETKAEKEVFHTE